MEFNMSWNIKNHSSPQVCDGEILVETAGYIDSQTRIENMIYAGQRLEDSRNEQFDFYDGVEFDEDVEIDPTRRPDFDMAEASQINNSMFAKFLKWKKHEQNVKNVNACTDLDDSKTADRTFEES